MGQVTEYDATERAALFGYVVEEVHCERCEGGVRNVSRGDGEFSRTVACKCIGGIESYAVRLVGEPAPLAYLDARRFDQADAEELACALGRAPIDSAADVAAEFELTGQLPGEGV